MPARKKIDRTNPDIAFILKLAPDWCDAEEFADRAFACTTSDEAFALMRDCTLQSETNVVSTILSKRLENGEIT